MTTTPMAFADSLQVGRVQYVSPDKIDVLLEIEAPDATALNTGEPRPFPRVNQYVLIPGEAGFTVGQIAWVTVENSTYPQRKGMRDFGLVDVPYPLRKLSLTPVGVLSRALNEVSEDDTAEGSVSKGGTNQNTFRFSRGVRAFPSVGDPVLLPTRAQLRAVVESGRDRRVLIGTSPIAADAAVMVDPDRIFGRHLAVLGNTGSGKSCSVAGLIRWSLEAAEAQRPDPAANTDGARTGSAHTANARFIVLDPNGEYSRTFADMNATVVSVITDGETDKQEDEAAKPAAQLRVPLWLWNTDEWASFAQATDKTQRPVLAHALRALRDGQLTPESSPTLEMRRFLRHFLEISQIEYRQCVPWRGFGPRIGFFDRIRALEKKFAEYEVFSGEEYTTLKELWEHMDAIVQARSTPKTRNKTLEVGEVEMLLAKARAAHSAFGGTDQDFLPLDADTPIPFTEDAFIRSLEAYAQMLGVAEYTETFLMRVRTLLGDSRLQPVISAEPEIKLEEWLSAYLGDGKSSAVTVVDLSMVPAEAVHVVTAVIARVILEALQRYRKLHAGDTLPTVLVMEEAHTFIKRYQADGEFKSAQQICTQIFERIAREGRKFGLGLVLSSQRPSELSPTVLSQCNTFLLHRLSNHTDQDLVHRLVPDNLRGLLRDLPSLPSQNAVLLGWAAELPVAVQMRHLPVQHRPRSDDPDFWDVWSGHDDAKDPVSRAVDWEVLARDWQQDSISRTEADREAETDVD